MRDLDIVILPDGRTGTIVDIRGASAMVEVWSDEDHYALETWPVADLKRKGD